MKSYKILLTKTSILICVVFSILCSLVYYISSYMFEKRAYIENANLQISNLAEKINSAFLYSNDLSYVLGSDKTVQDYVESDYPSAFDRKNVMQYFLTSINPSSTHNCITAIKQPNDNYLISGDSLCDFDYFTSQFSLPADDIIKIFNTYSSRNISSPTLYFTRKNKTNYMTILSCNKTSHLNQPYFLFSVYDVGKYLSLDKLESNLIISISDNVLFNDGDFTPKQLNQIIKGNEISGHTIGASTISTKTTDGEIKLTLITGKLKYLRAVNSHYAFAIFVLILLLIISFFVSRKISNKTYGPIEKLLSNIYDTSVEKDEDEIEYLTNVFNSINESNATLKAKLNNQGKPLREKFLSDLSLGHLTTEQINYGVSTHFPLSKDNYLPILYVIIDASSEDYDEATTNVQFDGNSFYHILYSALGRVLNDKTIFFLDTLSPKCFYAIVSCNDVDVLRKVLQNEFLILEDKFKVEINSSISEKVWDWANAQNEFFKAYHLHREALLAQTPKTVRLQNPENKEYIFYSSELDSKIIDNCLHLERDGAKKALNFIIEQNFSQDQSEKSREDNISQLSVLLYSLFIRILASANLDSEQIFGHDFNPYLELKLCTTQEELIKKSNFILDNISDSIINARSLSEDKYLDKMLHFLHNNYSRDISLMDLADYMNMSQSYVSRLFKRLANSTFRDYLAKIRVEKACILLVEQPNKNIAEIAAAVGFNNSKPFSALFIKVVGSTPTEYRRQKLD